MSKSKRTKSPWAELSVALDLSARHHLSLPILGDSDGVAARMWKLERMCRRVRRISLVVLYCTPFVCLGLLGLRLASLAISDFVDQYADVLGMCLVFWLVIWIGIPALTFAIGICLYFCRFRTRQLILLHAERQRRKNTLPLSDTPPSLAVIKSLLASTSLTQELVGPLVVLGVIALIVSYVYLGGFAAGYLTLPLLISVVIIAERLSNSAGSLASRNLDLAFRTGACPTCQYSLVGSGPAAMIKRCSECGMRFPCRLPVNLPPPRSSNMRSLGRKFRSALSRIH